MTDDLEGLAVLALAAGLALAIVLVAAGLAWRVAVHSWPIDWPAALLFDGAIAGLLGGLAAYALTRSR